MSLVESSLIQSCLIPGRNIPLSGFAFVVGNTLTGSAMGYISFDTASFNPVTLPLSGDVWTDVDFLGATGYSISNNNYIARTTDYGYNWTTLGILPSVTFSNGRSIKILGDGTVLAGGASTSIDVSTIWRSTDGGNNFSVVLNSSSSFTRYPIEDFSFIDNSVGYAVGYKNLFKTYDGGLSWSAMNTYLSAYYVNKIFCVDENTIYAANVAGGEEASRFSETTFNTALPIIATAYTSGVYYISSNNILFAGAKGNIFKDDGSFTTTANKINSSEYNLRDIHFSGTTGVVCGDYGALYTSTDNGVSWSQITANINTGYTFYAAKILNL